MTSTRAASIRTSSSTARRPLAALRALVHEDPDLAFGIAPSTEDVEAMRGAAQRDAKAGGAGFRPTEHDTAPDIEHLAARRLDPVYAELMSRAAAAR